METDGRHAKPGGREIEVEDNVVRLPRDWLGPREELIPFGPSAEVEDDGLATPPSTHDFWGEPATGLWESDPGTAEPMPRRMGGHRRAAGIAALIAASVAALVFALGGGATHHRELSAATNRAAPTQTALTSLTPGRALPSLTARGGHPAGHRSSSAARRPAKPRVKRRTAHRGRRHVTQAATVQRVRYRAPAANSSAPATSTSSASPPTPAAPSGSTQASAAQASGSTHQPALGAAGALAPGSSPDS